jgi:hypothetical protein
MVLDSYVGKKCETLLSMDLLEPLFGNEREIFNYEFNNQFVERIYLKPLNIKSRGVLKVFVDKELVYARMIVGESPEENVEIQKVAKNISLKFRRDTRQQRPTQPPTAQGSRPNDQYDCSNVLDLELSHTKRP